MFEPKEAGGYGLEPASELLAAGLVAQGHFCCEGDNGEWRWMESVEEAAKTQGFEVNKLTAEQWRRTVDALQKRGEPCWPEEARRLTAGVRDAETMTEERRRDAQLKKSAAARGHLLDELMAERKAGNTTAKPDKESRAAGVSAEEVERTGGKRQRQEGASEKGEEEGAGSEEEEGHRKEDPQQAAAEEQQQQISMAGWSLFTHNTRAIHIQGSFSAISFRLHRPFQPLLMNFFSL